MQMINPILNQHIFTQTDIDSGALTMLGTVVHNQREPGEYRGLVLLSEQSVATFYLEVDPSSAASQVNIDLATLNEPVNTEQGRQFTISPTGYVVFHVASGAGGFAVHLGKAGAGPQPKSFDSRELRDGDLFAANLLRPGVYEISNLLGQGRAEAVVDYPKPGEAPYRPPEPARVDCTAEGFRPERIRLQAAQGLIFSCKTAARIKIELVKPDDGPSGPRKPSRTGLHRAIP
jgi:hypothetical protein